VPLALFGIAVLGTIGGSDVWNNGLRPFFYRQRTPTAFTATETAVQKIFADGDPALPFFGGVHLLSYVSGLVRACRREPGETLPCVSKWRLGTVKGAIFRVVPQAAAR
jgi:hypothetical protein